MNYNILQDIDKDLDALKESIYSQNSLKLEDTDITLLKALNEKFKDVVGLMNYLARNQSELRSTTC